MVEGHRREGDPTLRVTHVDNRERTFPDASGPGGSAETRSRVRTEVRGREEILGDHCGTVTFPLGTGRSTRELSGFRVLQETNLRGGDPYVSFECPAHTTKSGVDDKGSPGRRVWSPGERTPIRDKRVLRTDTSMRRPGLLT